MTVKIARDKVVHVRLSDDEFNTFNAACIASGLSASELIRRQVRSVAGQGPSFDGETRNTIRAMIRQMRAIGVNINQVARLMNSGRVPADEDMQASFGLLLELLNEQQDFLLSLCARERRRVMNPGVEQQLEDGGIGQGD